MQRHVPSLRRHEGHLALFSMSSTVAQDYHSPASAASLSLYALARMPPVPPSHVSYRIRNCPCRYRLLVTRRLRIFACGYLATALSHLCHRASPSFRFTTQYVTTPRAFLTAHGTGPGGPFLCQCTSACPCHRIYLDITPPHLCQRVLPSVAHYRTACCGQQCNVFLY